MESIIVACITGVVTLVGVILTHTDIHAEPAHPAQHEARPNSQTPRPFRLVLYKPW